MRFASFLPLRAAKLAALCLLALSAAPPAGEYAGETQGVSVQPAPISRVQRFTQATSSGVHLVYFTASWCAPCAIQGPIIEKVANEFIGRATVWKTDVDKFKDIADHFRISAVPSILVVKDGRPVHATTGLQTEEALRSLLARLTTG